MTELEVSPLARRDLKEIAEYSSTQSASLALGMRFLAAAQKTFLRITDFPLTGRLVEHDQRGLFGLRSVLIRGFENYAVIYSYSDQLVQVLRVLHGARDQGRLIGVD